MGGSNKKRHTEHSVTFVAIFLGEFGGVNPCIGGSNPSCFHWEVYFIEKKGINSRQAPGIVMFSGHILQIFEAYKVY